MRYMEDLDKIFNNLSTDQEKKAFLKKMFEYRDTILDKYTDEINDAMLLLFFNKEKNYLDLIDINTNVIDDRLDENIRNNLLSDPLSGKDILLLLCKKIYSIIFEHKSQYDIRQILNESNNTEYISILLSCINDDELKLEYIDKIEYSYKIDIIISLLNDELKIKYLGMYKDEYDKASIIASLSSDQLKIKYLDEINDESSKVIIIASLSSDQLKREYIDKIENYYRIDIILSLESEDLKIEYLNKYKDEYFKCEIIESLSSDELKMKYLDEVGDFLKKNIIASLSSDELKIEYLDKYKDDSNRTCIIVSLSSEELRIKYIDKEKTDYAKINIILSLSDDKLKIKYLSKINDNSNKMQVLSIVKNKSLVLEYFINNNYSIYDINNFFLNVNDKLEYSENEIFLKYMKKISEYYNLNYDHIHSLANLVGTDILINIEKENIKNLINLEDNAFNNFINLFKEENKRLNSSDINDIINVILSNQFKIKKSEILNVFTLIKNLIDENKKEEIIRISQELIGIDLFNEKLKQFHFDDTVENFIIKLLDKKDINHEKYLEILHSITNEFITLSKNRYINNNRDNLLNKISGKRYNKANIIKYAIKEYTFEEFKNLFEKIKKDRLSEEIKNLINNEEILKRIIAFKNNPNQIIEDKELFSYMKTFSLLMNILYEQDLLVPKKGYQDIISREKSLFALSKRDIYNIIINLNIKSMLEEDGILSNQELYDKLQEKLKNYKILGYGNYLNEILKIDELDSGVSLAVAFLNNCALITDIIEKKGKENLTIFLHLVNAFSDMSNKYALLIGSENYRLIKENPGPNSSSMTYDGRIQQIPSLVKAMYERDSITIPPMNKIVELGNGQKLEVIVGDVIDVDNLTHGERTGSCMRIGGVGEKLFEFCLKNEQGFHIKIIDPNTSEYISRVSGFRNGNTVFLNELRYSLNNKYSNENLEETCTRISEMLIEMTKNSLYPIENVIISQEFAMSFTRKNKISLPISSIKKGYENLYLDVSSENAILLASSIKDKLVNIKLGPDNCERYDPIRKKPQVVSPVNTLQLKARMEIIDQLLSGIEFEDCQYNSEFNDIKEAYFGQDWYFIVLENGEILTYIMKNSKNRNLALQEIKKTVPSELLNNNKLNAKLVGIKK